MFCPKCGSLLIPKKDGNKKVLACSCGYATAAIEQTKIKEEVEKEEAEMDVVDKDHEHLPVMEADCEKCGNGKAYYWLSQTRAGDEPETKFLRCTKCRHTWRDYS